jgi:hypothetical protein
MYLPKRCIGVIGVGQVSQQHPQAPVIKQVSRHESNMSQRSDSLSIIQCLGLCNHYRLNLELSYGPLNAFGVAAMLLHLLQFVLC